jgi:hypothetical protein
MRLLKIQMQIPDTFSGLIARQPMDTTTNSGIKTKSHHNQANVFN